MSKLFDYNIEPKDDIITRILLNVHLAIDENFPNAEAAPKRFSQTVFNKDQGEDTQINTSDIDKSEENINIKTDPHLKQLDEHTKSVESKIFSNFDTDFTKITTKSKFRLIYLFMFLSVIIIFVLIYFEDINVFVTSLFRQFLPQ